MTIYYRVTFLLLRLPSTAAENRIQAAVFSETDYTRPLYQLIWGTVLFLFTTCFRYCFFLLACLTAPLWSLSQGAVCLAVVAVGLPLAYGWTNNVMTQISQAKNEDSKARYEEIQAAVYSKQVARLNRIRVEQGLAAVPTEVPTYTGQKSNSGTPAALSAESQGAISS